MDWNLYNEMSALESSGSLEQALRGFNDLESESVDAEDKVLVLLAISDCLGRLRRYPEARQAIEKASLLVARSNQIYPRIAFKDAYIEVYVRDWKKALSKIDAIRKDSYDALLLPENADLVEQLQISRGVVLVELHRYREALPLLEQAAKANLEDAMVLTYLGACYFDAKDFERSKECLLKALKLGVDHNYRHKIHFFLGSIYYAQGKFAWAKQEFEESLKQGQNQEFADKDVYDYLIQASEWLGLETEVERYSKLRQQVDQPSKTSK